MSHIANEFDPGVFARREPEVLVVLAQHVCALSRVQPKTPPRKA